MAFPAPRAVSVTPTPHRTSDRPVAGARCAGAPPSNRGPQPVRARTSQTRRSRSAGVRRGERCGRLERSNAHALDARCSALAPNQRHFHLCAVPLETERQAAACLSDISISIIKRTSSTHQQVRLAPKVLTHPGPPSVWILRNWPTDTRRFEHRLFLSTSSQPVWAAQLDERGCGVLTAAKLLGEIAGVARFGNEAKVARTAGSAPIPASSGRTQRHRLDRGGNRQLNCALHRLAVTKGRLDPETAAYLARKPTEGKNPKEAIRCLKRHLTRRVWHLLRPDPRPPSPPTLRHPAHAASPSTATHRSEASS